MSTGNVRGRSFVLPGDTAQYPRHTPLKVEHVALRVSLDFAAKAIEGSVAVRLRAVRDGVDSVRLDARDMVVGSVRTEAGAALAHRWEDRTIVTRLPTALATGERITLVVDYRAVPERGLYFVRQEQAWTQGQPDDSPRWFPCVDEPGMKATSEMHVTVPEGLFALSNGDLVEVTREGGRVTHHWKHDVPHPAYLVSLAVGRFEEHHEEADGIALQYYYPPGRGADARRAFGRTPEMLREFTKLIGVRYPYGKYAQVVVDDFTFGGMENTTATTFHDFVLHDERAALDFTADTIVAHELAHQWFGDLVTCRQWSEAWLNEGVATFFEFVDREIALGRDEADFYRADTRAGYMEEDSGRYSRPIVERSFHSPIDVFDRHLYNKGGLVLAMLRERIGEGRFWQALGGYLERHRGGTVETVDLVRAFEETTGESLGRFFDQWIHSGGHPDLGATFEWNEEQKLARITIEQRQAADGSSTFDLDLRVRVVCTGVLPIEKRLHVASRRETLTLPLPDRPTRVAIDPGDVVLKTIDLGFPVEMLAASLREEPEAIARGRAAEALGRKGGVAAVEALGRSLVEDPFWGVRAEAAKALGTIRSERALGALLGGRSASTHPKARRAFVKALGEFRNEAAANVLLEILAGDPSYYVEGEAARALGKTRDSRAFDAITAAIGRPSHMDAVAVGCLDGLAELGDARGLAVAIEWTKVGKPSFARRAACAAVAKLGEGKRDAREALEVALSDRDLRVRLAAARALALLQDADAIPELEGALLREQEGRVVRMIRETLRDLREGRTRSDEIRRLRDELENLKKENRSLADRVEKLEALEGRS